MIEVVCWKWKPFEGFRTEFTAYHVNTLYHMVKRNTMIPFRFNCVTDDPEGILPEIRIVPLWDNCKDLKNTDRRGLKPSCYRRLKAFSKDVPFEDRIVSIDLDCVIVGNIDDILSRPEDFVCLQGTAKKTPYNGGLWSLKVGTRLQVWETFDPKVSPKLSKSSGFVGSDQGWISYVLGPKEKTYSDKDGVYCFMQDFFKKKRFDLPENTKIVMFQGGKDPWDRDVREKYPWVNLHYRMDTESPAVFPSEPALAPKVVPKPDPKKKGREPKTPQPKPKPAPINCITFLWGKGPYNADYVNKLFNMIDRHLSLPHKNICFTNTPEGIREGIEIKPLLSHWMFGNLKKMIQYDPNNGLKGRVLSFDLDNVIIGSLDVFAEYKGEFIIQEAISSSRKGKSAGNCMAFEAGYGADTIWKPLVENHDYYAKQTGGSERFLYDILIKEMDFWEPGLIVSHKLQVRKKKVKDWSKVRMIFCHGRGKPHELTSKLIRNNWR